MEGDGHVSLVQQADSSSVDLVCNSLVCVHGGDLGGHDEGGNSICVVVSEGMGMAAVGPSSNNVIDVGGRESEYNNGVALNEIVPSAESVWRLLRVGSNSHLSILGHVSPSPKDM
ncbi:unnamed protein product [Amaranthus hypochondriacus]